MLLVAICGIDGSGKTTQIKLLNDYLEKKGKKTYLTKQPTDFYRKYDRFRKYVNREIDAHDSKIIQELALLSAADKLRQYETELLPNEDKIIICDRYVFSAYSYFLARGITNISWLKEINKFLPLPTLTIYLDIDPVIALERIISRDGKYTKKEETEIDLLTTVRNIFCNQPWGKTSNYYVINSSARSIDEVHQEIVHIIERYMGD